MLVAGILARATTRMILETLYIVGSDVPQIRKGQGHICSPYPAPHIHLTLQTTRQPLPTTSLSSYRIGGAFPATEITVKFIDITFLYTEMLDPANTGIPSDHPYAGNLIEIRPYLSDIFDRVICDGQVLRTHKRAEYREPVEATRHLVSQLVLALQRIRA